MLSGSEESLTFPLACLSVRAFLQLPSHDSSLADALFSRLRGNTQVWLPSPVPLFVHCTCSFSECSRTKEEFYFCKANHCPSTVSLSAKKHPLYRRHPGTCSRLAGRKRCVCTLESEKTYSFRCVFSFSVSSTITSLLGTFWDLISCKTEQRPGVMSCSH